MIVGFDIDGTIDSFPQVFLGLCTALVSAGHQVWIITGASGDKVTQAETNGKESLLIGLGFGKGSYSKLFVLPEPHAQNKAKLLAKEHVDLMIDNNTKNAKAAKEICPVLILWQSKTKV
jgi:hypothetical protein